MFHPYHVQNSQTKPPRAGFTLIELLITISIIALLASLILGAVAGARKSAVDASVKSEISAIESALMSFQTEYGRVPPSKITIYETAAGWNGDPQSKAFIRELWPQYDFTDRAAGKSLVDDNQDGDLTNDPVNDAYPISAAEALVFFLAGPVQNAGTVASPLYQPLGFSANPRDPFDRVSKNRKKGFFEFDITRLADPDGDGFPAYVDKYKVPEGKPIAYFSAYSGSGYNPAEVTDAGMRDVYRQVWTFNATLNFDNTIYPHTPWKEKDFQLISPGRDGEYGLGGYYQESIPRPGSVTDAVWQDFQAQRVPDADNITNFAAGTLK